MTEPQTQPAAATEPEVSPTTSTTGLRQRSVNVTTREVPAPDFRTVWASMAQTYNGFPDPNQYAMHAAIMQQAYAQYINQYMQM